MVVNYIDGFLTSYLFFFFYFQQTVKGLVGWRRLYCALRGGKLRCFYGPEEIEAKVEPTLVVSIDKVSVSGLLFCDKHSTTESQLQTF